MPEICQWKIDFTFSGYIFFSFSLCNCSNFQECQRAASWIGIQNVKRCKFFGPIKCTEILSVAAFELGYNVSKWRDDARRWKGLCPLWDFWISVILWVLRSTQFKFVANLRMRNNSLNNCLFQVETLIWFYPLNTRWTWNGSDGPRMGPLKVYGLGPSKSGFVWAPYIQRNPPKLSPVKNSS